LLSRSPEAGRPSVRAKPPCSARSTDASEVYPTVVGDGSLFLLAPYFLEGGRRDGGRGLLDEREVPGALQAIAKELEANVKAARFLDRRG
jgi:hypothetical protein